MAIDTFAGLKDFKLRRHFFDTHIAKRHLSIYTCPSCGFPTLEGRSEYEICDVCNWEDSGQDDPDADTAYGGPNGGFSLTGSRCSIALQIMENESPSAPVWGSGDDAANERIAAEVLATIERHRQQKAAFAAGISADGWTEDVCQQYERFRDDLVTALAELGSGSSLLGPERGRDESANDGVKRPADSDADAGFDELVCALRREHSVERVDALLDRLATLPQWHFLAGPDAPERPVQVRFQNRPDPCLLAFTSAARAEAFAREAGLLSARGIPHVVAPRVEDAVRWLGSLNTDASWVCFNLGSSSEDFPLELRQLALPMFNRVGPALVPMAGDLLSVEENGRFAVVKVLVVDDGGVHVRLYAQRFEHRPREVSLDQLWLEPFRVGQPLSAAHLPISRQGFQRWQPELILAGFPVLTEELEGYEMWRSNEGGYF